ncbi:MAG: hypothetical protein AAFR93_01975 [Pseudomonadota bacterium]
MWTETLFQHPLTRLAELQRADSLWSSDCFVGGRDDGLVSSLVAAALVEFALSNHGSADQRALAGDMARSATLKLSLREAGATGSEMDEGIDCVTSYLVLRLLEQLDQLPRTDTIFPAAHRPDAVVRHPSLRSFLNLKLGRDLVGQPTEMDAVRVLTLHRAGEIDQAKLADLWRVRFAGEQGWDGTWDNVTGLGYGLATCIMVMLWTAAGRPAPRPRPVHITAQETLFERCNLVMALAKIDGEAARAPATQIFQSMAADVQWGRVGPLTCAAALKLSAEMAQHAPAAATRPAALRLVS